MNHSQMDINMAREARLRAAIIKDKDHPGRVYVTSLGHLSALSTARRSVRHENQWTAPAAFFMGWQGRQLLIAFQGRRLWEVPAGGGKV
jgi:hypothetical protein